MKIFPTEIRDEFYRKKFIAVDVVYLGIPDSTGAVTNSSVLRLCTGGIDLDLLDPFDVLQTYTAQGDFIGFSTVTEEFDVKVGKFSIYLSGLGTDMVSRWIDRDVEGKQVQIAKVFLDYNTLEVINAPYVVFDGIIYNISVVESNTTCNVNIECATLWADFERTTGRMTNNQSNWRFQFGVTTDKSFEKTATVGNVEYKWGRT